MSGRIVWTACATAIAASPKPVAISLILPSNVVMSPHAQTRSSDVLERRPSTLIAFFSSSKPHSLSGPSFVEKPSCSRIASHSIGERVVLALGRAVQHDALDVAVAA